MTMLNKVELIGIVASSQIVRVEGGKVIVRFSMATEYAYKNRNGEACIDTTWHDCQVLQDTSAPVPYRKEYWHVKGRLSNTRYTTASGEEKYIVSVAVEKMEKVDKDQASTVVTSEALSDEIYQIGKKAEQAVKTLLEENKLTSVNVNQYINDGPEIQNYAFFDTDKNGNGECLQLETVRLNEKKEVEVEFYTNYGDFFCDEDLHDLSAEEKVYVLSMLEEILEYSKEENVHVLAEGEDWDDILNDDEDKD